MCIDVATIGFQFISKSSDGLYICFNFHGVFPQIMQFCLKLHNSCLRFAFHTSFAVSLPTTIGMVDSVSDEFIIASTTLSILKQTL